MHFTDWLGKLLGVEGGIDKIQSGYAGLIGLVVVMLGWLVTARREANRYRVERAHETVLVENEKLKQSIAVIRPYLVQRKQLPTADNFRGPENAKLKEALEVVMTNLEILALDIATGRASEQYVKASQRHLVCTICVCSREFVRSVQARNQRGAYRQLERLFIRFYMNHTPVLQWIIEYIWGKPLFKYSHLVFQLRYIFASTNWSLDPDYRKEDWDRIGECMRKIRHFTQGVLAFSASVAAYLVFKPF